MIFLIFYPVLTDLFIDRVNGDMGRENMFTQLVDKKCNNLRRTLVERR